MLTVFISLTKVIYAEETVHIVQKGETIYSLARSYKVSVEDLMKFNGIMDPQRLQAGQRLNIPGTGAIASGFVEYRVSKGDTLYSIARHYDITLQSLRNANSLSDSYVLKEGDLLRIPRANREPGRPASSGGTVATIPQVTTPVTPRTTSSSSQVPSTSATPRSTEGKRVDTSIRWPVAAKEVLYMTGKLYGVALLGEKSEAVKSLTQGIVVSAGPYRGFGRVAIVQVTGGYLYVYGGCESLSVKEGDKVTSGTELGRLGIDAVSKKPQLFFLVYHSNTPMDPIKAPRS
jgi:murein DD-endopeptidase MepM/ murein hydrolase activator NlpD